MYEYWNNTAVTRTLQWIPAAQIMNRKTTFRILTRLTIEIDDVRMGRRKENTNLKNVYPSHNDKLFFHY